MSACHNELWERRTSEHDRFFMHSLTYAGTGRRKPVPYGRCSLRVGTLPRVETPMEQARDPLNSMTNP